MPDGDLLPETLALAEKLSRIQKEALTETKQLFHKVADLPLEEALKRGRDINQRMRAFGKR